MRLAFRITTSAIAAALAIALLLFASTVHAQTVPIVTIADFVKFDAFKADISRAGFKVQIQMDASTGTWFDVPTATLGAPTVLPDTAADSVTYQVQIAANTPVGLHTLFVRYCVSDGAAGVTCGPLSSGRFDLRTTAPPPGVQPPAAPGNLRFGPKSGGGTPAAVDAFGWLNDVPRVDGMSGKGA